MNTKQILAIAGALALSMSAANIAAGERSIANTKSESTAWIYSGQSEALHTMKLASADGENSTANRLSEYGPQHLNGAELAAYLMEYAPTAAGGTHYPMMDVASTAAQYKQHQFGSND